MRRRRDCASYLDRKPTAAVSWQWPISVTDYDRSGALSPVERDVLVQDMAHALDRERTTSGVLASLHGIERLIIPSMMRLK